MYGCLNIVSLSIAQLYYVFYELQRLHDMMKWFTMTQNIIQETLNSNLLEMFF